MKKELNFDCSWPGNDALMLQYHNEEWGVPLHDDNKLFEFLVLDAFQAGLSWRTILHKRENFRKAFDNYDIQKIALYDEEKIMSLMSDSSIIRNQLKIRATVQNAISFSNIQIEYGTFDKFIWQFTNGKTIINKFKFMSEIPCKSVESEAMSKAMIKNGFKFVGPTICYSVMQAIGMVNDHIITCHRHNLCR